MKKIALISSFLLMIGCWSAATAACFKTLPLFKIERSKNGNIVQYDICVSDNGDVPDPAPVKAHWVLESGAREDLNILQRKYAYGILSQEKLEANTFRIALVAFKDRMILIRKVSNQFRATMSIGGTQSILDKIYVKAEERIGRFPKVHYVEVFGRTMQTDTPVTERIIPQ